MHALYLLCFLVGLLLSLVLAVTGQIGGHSFGVRHAGGHHVGGHHAGGHHGGAQHAGSHHATAHRGASAAHSILGFAVGVLSPISLAGAALLFGGVGLLLGSSSMALAAAIVAGVAGALAFHLLMSTLISSSTAPLSLSAEGAIGMVNASIRPDASGEVVYTLEGLHRSIPARSSTGKPIPRGTEVVITRRERGIAWVEPLIPLGDREGE